MLLRLFSSAKVFLSAVNFTFNDFMTSIMKFMTVIFYTFLDIL